MTEVAERCAAILRDAFPEGGQWSAEDIAGMLAQPGAHLIENAGGFLIAKSVLDEAEIWTIATRPDMRRKGHARALLAEAESLLSARGVRQVFLEVSANNPAALALYVTSGFSESRRRKGYYRDGDGTPTDAICMMKTLVF